MTDACSACGCPLTWALSTGGAPSPIETETSDKGNVLLINPRGLGATLAVVLSKGALELARTREVPLHLNHFAYCPEKERFKRTSA
jgi:hypothetical protein